MPNSLNLEAQTQQPGSPGWLIERQFIEVFFPWESTTFARYVAASIFRCDDL
jgi:hypothetical protein